MEIFKPKMIIVHHSLTEDSGTVSWEAIRDYHMNERGWNDIGYHFGVERVKDEIEVLCGRPLNIPGAHCKGKNRKSLGVCFVGNYDAVDVPTPMWLRGLRLVHGLRFIFDIPVSQVHGHSDFSGKSCPGYRFDMEQFRKDLYYI